MADMDDRNRDGSVPYLQFSRLEWTTSVVSCIAQLLVVPGLSV
jgi:hypothetical protein